MIQSILRNEENIQINLNEEVASVTKLLQNGNQLYEVLTISGHRDTFEIVVLACPLDLTNIELPNYVVKMDRTYETVHANFIARDINYQYFNNVKNKPQTIFTIVDEDIPFVSIAKLLLHRIGTFRFIKCFLEMLWMTLFLIKSLKIGKVALIMNGKRIQNSLQ